MVKDLRILDCKFGFSRPNCIYYQLERSGGQEYGENTTNGLTHLFHRGCFFSDTLRSKARMEYCRPQIQTLR